MSECKMMRSSPILSVLVAGSLFAMSCGEKPQEAPPQQPASYVTDDVHRSLGKAGYDDVGVASKDGSLTLSGTVPSTADKSNVESIVRAEDRGLSVRDETFVGQAATAPQAVTQVENPKANYSVVRVFYATDRKSSSPGPPLATYSGDRSDDGSLSLGTLDVSVPKSHVIGDIERPSILRFEFREDPNKHMILARVAPKPEAAFFQELSARIANSTSKQAFVFIHGYDVTFTDAALRAAQIAYDLSPFDAAPIMYSWPSKGDLVDYPADEATIEWTAPHLKTFLEKVANETHATTVNLIAHSMGNRAVTTALSSIATERHGLPPMFQEVFLAAPDIDVGVFKQLAGALTDSAQHVTIYVSSKDKALLASRKFHKDDRVGDSRVVIIFPKMDTIDATAVDTGFLEHSYYPNRTILTDIFTVLQRYYPPGQRFGMRPDNARDPRYWVFRP